MRIRAIKEIATVETDISIAVREMDTQTVVIPMSANTDYLYLGQAFPFNHFYFKFGTVNTVPAKMKVEYWEANAWREVIDLFDETSLAGASYGQDGYVTWIPNKRYNWGHDDTIDQNGKVKITGIDTITVYDYYWVKISFNGTLTPGTSINWIGNKFTNDTDLYREYPVLNSASFLTSFAAGKTTWEEQHVVGANEIIDDLIAKKIIFHPGQILDRLTFKMMSVPKVAEIIFNSLGDDYANDKTNAYNLYIRRFSKDIYNIDNDMDGRLSTNEQTVRQGGLYR